MELPLIPLTGLLGNDVPHLSTLQMWMLPFAEYFIAAWWCTWVLSLGFVIVYILRKGSRHE